MSRRESSRVIFTHFVALPIYSNSQDVVWKQFRDKTMKLVPFIHKHMIVPWQRFHMTLFMLSLRTNDQILRAKQILREFNDDFNTNVDPLKLHLKGLDIMKGSREKAKLVYLNVNPLDNAKNRFETLVNELALAFSDSGFAYNSRDGSLITKSNMIFPKVHVTVINTKYGPKVMSKTEKFDRSFNINSNTLDVSSLMAELDEIDFGHVEVEEIQLCELSRKKIRQEDNYSQYYNVEFSKSLAKNLSHS